jgi:hypothetical protein
VALFIPSSSIRPLFSLMEYKTLGEGMPSLSTLGYSSWLIQPPLFQAHGGNTGLRKTSSERGAGGSGPYGQYVWGRAIGAH